MTAHAVHFVPAPSVEDCRYGESRLVFRGPPRSLEGDYVLFLGGSDTFGKLVPDTYPAQLEPALGLPCVNMGCVNAGIDTVLKDYTVMQAARAARVVVISAFNAQNLSNRLYTVHPRRNDRFLRASDELRALYPTMDFADYNFTGRLLHDLYRANPRRFAHVRDELRIAWAARMKLLMAEIGKPVVMLWPERRKSGAVRTTSQPAPPHILTGSDVEAVRGSAQAVVTYRPPDGGALMSAADHGRVAEGLLAPLQRVLAEAQTPNARADRRKSERP